jgi:outer membrane protein TolC
VNTTTILDLITAREAAASAARDDLREQMTKIAGELAAIECELSDLATTRQTLIKLTQAEVTSADPAIISEPYQREGCNVSARP